MRSRTNVLTGMDMAISVTYQSLMTLLTASPKLAGLDPARR